MYGASAEALTGSPGTQSQAESSSKTRSTTPLPQIDSERFRHLAEDAIIVSYGLTLLIGDRIAEVIQAAREKGQAQRNEAGPLIRSLLDMVAERRPTASQPVKVQVLPINDYDRLTAEEVTTRLEGLTEPQLRIVRQYEATHQNRAQVLLAADRLLGGEAI